MHTTVDSRKMLLENRVGRGLPVSSMKEKGLMKTSMKSVLSHRQWKILHLVVDQRVFAPFQPFFHESIHQL